MERKLHRYLPADDASTAGMYPEGTSDGTGKPKHFMAEVCPNCLQSDMDFR